MIRSFPTSSLFLRGHQQWTPQSTQRRTFAKKKSKKTAFFEPLPVKKTVDENVKHEIYVWGRGDKGQLGLGAVVTTSAWPSTLGFTDKEAREVQCGANHVLIRTPDSLYAFGVSASGQLGYKIEDPREKWVQYLPKKVDFDIAANITHMAGGGHHTLIAVDKGNGDTKVYATGSNKYGQLGLSLKEELVFELTEVPSLRGRPISSISCGEDFSVVSLKDKEVLAFGRNDVGQLGPQGGNGGPSLVSIPSVGPAIRVRCGWGHTLATDGKLLWTWGANLHGQCAQPKQAIVTPKKIDFPVSSPIKQLACGSTHSLILLENGQVYVFGSHADGKLGIETAEEDLEVPTKIDFFDDKEVVSLWSGLDHSGVVTKSGNIYIWGFGQHMQLGLGQFNVRNFKSPQKIEPPQGFIYTACAATMDTTIATCVRTAPNPMMGMSSPSS